MNRVDVDYFKQKIVDIAIAEEVIETSVMNESVRETFRVILKSAKDNPEDWELLRDHLAGWLYKNQAM